MRQRNVFFVLSLIVALFAMSQPVQAADAIPGEYLVKYKGHSFTSMSSVRSIPMVRIADHNPKGQILKVLVKASDEVGALSRLLKDPNVEYVVPNIRLHAFRTPYEMSTQGLQEQWAMKKVNAESAWAKAGNKGKRSTTVAVIDTGIDYNHAALKPNMVAGYDFRENDNDPYDKTSAQNPGHGTHCAGIIGASGLVEGGIVGISPEVSLMPIRFLGEDGSGDLNNGIKAIDYAIEKKVQVISASWGATIGRAQVAPLIEAVKRANDAGVIMVMAAANDGRDNDKTDVFPTNANFEHTISVSASGPNDEKPQWSNFGKRYVQLASPGLNIMSTLPADKYGNLSGTSMATPLVSGLVAFLKSQKPQLTGAQTRSLLQHTGAKVAIDTNCNCRVDADAAVTKLLSNDMFITPAAGAMEKGETMKFEGSFGKAPFTFAVANASVGTISAEGLFTAVANGETTVSVKDADGKSSTSLPIQVVEKSTQPPGGGACPIGDQQLCDILCGIQPELPFCQK